MACAPKPALRARSDRTWMRQSAQPADAVKHPQNPCKIAAHDSRLPPTTGAVLEGDRRRSYPRQHPVTNPRKLHKSPKLARV